MRPAVFLHRWLGIPMSAFFALWFASGAVLLFVPYPVLTSSERLLGSPQIDAAAIRVAPAEAVARAEQALGIADISRVRIVGRLARAPAFVVEGLLPRSSGGGQRAVVVDAASGSIAPLIDPEHAERIAAAFQATTRSTRAAITVTGPFRYDQWVVHQRFDSARPFYKATLSDPKGTALYVSAATGEVLQKTTRTQRVWNLMGAVTHWIYPTVLRRDWALWDGLVWWLSLAGVGVAVLGLAIGVVRLRADHSLEGWARWTPYRGWVRWHHLLGIGGGLFLLTWIVSGWLSMDHGRLFATPDPNERMESRYYDASLREAIRPVKEADLSRLAGYTEAEFAVFDGAPLLIASASDRRSVFGWPEESRALSELVVPREGIAQALQRAWPGFTVGEGRAVASADWYGSLLEGALPASTLRFEVSDPMDTWVHVDQETGQIIGVMNRSRRAYRWLYNGLHSFDFPGLASRPVLRRAIMLPLLVLGFALCVTSLVMSWSALRSRWNRWRHPLRGGNRPKT